MSGSYEDEAIVLEQYIKKALAEFVVSHPKAPPKAYVYAFIGIANLLDSYMYSKDDPRERFSHILREGLDILIKQNRKG